MRYWVTIALALLCWACCYLILERSMGVSRVADLNPEMILVPTGEFMMGSDEEALRERPAHRLYVSAFYIDKFEVTNAQFDRFVKGTGYQSQGNWQKYNSPGREDHPVVNVSWYDAVAYLTWAKKRLPTEAEWEKAARGDLAGKRFPWGDEIDMAKANYGEIKGGTTPVGIYSPNGYGLFDMAGNAWEWVADFYQETYYKNSPYENPKGPNGGSGRALRGGAWDVGFYALRCSARNWNPPDFWDNCIGFRGARNAN